jgi:hypothetical protein
MRCDNTPCDAPATHKGRTDKGQELRFCQLCAEAFQWGQARPEVTCVPIDCPVDCVQEWCVEAFTAEKACRTVDDLVCTTVKVALSGDGGDGR